MKMELRQLKYFRAVAGTLNFSKAAEQLHIAQPPLSRQIQQLEDELGVRLLDRSSRPMRLTNAGVFFHEQSVRLLERIEAIRDETRRLGSGARRWMGVGFAPSILYDFIPQAIRQFSLDNGSVETSLLELTSVQQAEALKAGRIDIGFGRLRIEDEALENVLLAEEPLVAAVPAGSPLAAEGRIVLEALLEEVLLLYPASPRPSFIDQVLQQFAARGYRIGKSLETNSLQTAIGLVAAGMGVTLVPQCVQRLRRDDIVYRPLADRKLGAALIMTTRAGDGADHVLKLRATIVNASMARSRGTCRPLP
ncbi:Transcriptional regulator, LysR family [Azotobacter vinelandii CA]|uniref:Transcriptional regulator, LysR family n=3 Tax=Azotobacter group TaxID=351 RepID=C1DMT7_AZOVD|nr:Transcriptional regulator, LysR family [Azotobacter vinelandii DJ]AGK15482.1 Transcriptional regulator, LysR family [Azotobacter vinelandii CA]AGK19569.1 Transcriptional regulator, LysR family [Azotobacter vinelandii CA6]